MPTYPFRCDVCDTDIDVVAPITEGPPADGVVPCKASPNCIGLLHRQWAGRAPAIAAVPGGGGSPARGAS